MCVCVRACVMEERSMLLSSRYLMEEMLESQYIDTKIVWG